MLIISKSQSYYVVFYFFKNAVCLSTVEKHENVKSRPGFLCFLLLFYLHGVLFSCNTF